MDKKLFKNLIDHEEYFLKFDDINILVMDGVFTPDQSMTYSTQQSLDYLKNINIIDKKVFDIGCGTGVLGIHCLKKGAQHVVFSDISSQAIINTEKNLEINRQSKDRFSIIKTSMFNDIKERFDIIFANLPISDDVFGYEKNTTNNIVKTFLDNCLLYLNKDGKVILNWGSFEDVSFLENYLKDNGFKYKKIETNKLGFIWYLFEVSN